MVRQPSRAGVNGPANQAVQRAMRWSFLSEVIGELRKVEWPTREQVIRLSLIVIGISAVIGAMLALVDLGFTYLVNKLFLGV